MPALKHAICLTDYWAIWCTGADFIELTLLWPVIFAHQCLITSSMCPSQVSRIGRLSADTVAVLHLALFCLLSSIGHIRHVEGSQFTPFSCEW